MIKDKVVIISGASSGIGEAPAKRIESEGGKVVPGARREDKLKQIADDIKADGGESVYQTLDVTDQAENKAIVAPAKDSFGGVDAIFPNAAVYGGTKWFVRDFMEVLRMESACEQTNIRTATIYPAAINMELLNTITDEDSAEAMQGL